MYIVAQIALRGYSDGTGPIMLSRVSCNGNESSILECDYNGPSFADAHYKDVGAKCFRTPSKKLLLLHVHVGIYKQVHIPVSLVIYV